MEKIPIITPSVFTITPVIFARTFSIGVSFILIRGYMTRKKADNEKKKRGRPTVYTPAYHPRKAGELAAMGLTDVQMAVVFDIDESTLNRWKIRYPDFCMSLQEGKDQVDDTIENSLYKRAQGMEITRKKIVEYSDGTRRKEIVVESVPPSLPAIIFWLKNRQPQVWRDKPEPEIPKNEDIPSPGMVILPESLKIIGDILARNNPLELQKSGIGMSTSDGDVTPGETFR